MQLHAGKASQLMSQKAGKSGNIAYRLRVRELKQVEGEAEKDGVTANEWCRRAALEKLQGQTRIFAGPGEWEIYRLLAQVRFLLGHSVRLQATGNLTPREWDKLRKEATESATAIATELLGGDRS